MVPRGTCSWAPPCHPVTVSPTCAKKNKGSLSENIDNPLLTSPRVDVIQGNTIALFFLVMAAGGYGRPCERTVTLRGKPAGEGRPGRKMRARAASPFPEPFMQYKETQMNTRGINRQKSFKHIQKRQNNPNGTPPYLIAFAAPGLWSSLKASTSTLFTANGKYWLNSTLPPRNPVNIKPSCSVNIMIPPQNE